MHIFFHGLRLVAGAVAVLLAGQVHAASTVSGGSSLTGSVGSVAVTPGVLSDTLVDVTGINSIATQGTPGNIVRTFNVGAGASVIGIGWNVNVTAFDPSWLSELVVGFGSSSANEVNLSVGVGDDLPGTMSYSSAGIVDLVALGLNFNVGADGIVRLEFFEGFDDSAVSPDGIWNSGSLTIQVAAIPEPSTYATMALGLLAVGGLARRKARG
jgi:hypothetical protein